MPTISSPIALTLDDIGDGLAQVAAINQRLAAALACHGALRVRWGDPLRNGLLDLNEPKDMRVLHINDGTILHPDDEGRYSDIFQFSDGIAMRDWKVVQADCRPWRNYCRVVVERM